MIGRDAPWCRPGVGDFTAKAVGAWVQATDSALSDLLTGGPDAFFDLGVLPGPRGLEERAVTTAALVRSLTMGTPAPDTVATLGGLVRGFAARFTGPRRFDPPAAAARALLLALLLALVAEAGR